MPLKNKIISLLFFISMIGTPNALYSMNQQQQETALNQLKKQQQELKQEIAAQKAKMQKIEDQKIQEEDEQIRAQQLKNKRAFNIQLEEDTIKLEQAKRREKITQHEQEELAKKTQSEREAQAQRHKENLDTEALKQAQQTTKAAINTNDAKRQIGIKAVDNFSKGMSTALGNSISGSFVNAVQKELDYLYSQYRPTQMTLLQEVEGASRIIHQGITNVSEYYDKQLKLILSSQNKNPEVINEEVRALKAETYLAYAELDAMEKESRDRLRQSYNFRNPNFGRTTQEPKKNIFEDPKEPSRHNENPSTAKPQNNGTSKNTPKGIIKKAASLIAAAPIIFADKIVNAFSIDSHVNQLTQLEPLKTDWAVTHTKEISRVAALSLFVTTAALLYKSYSWYYNQDRITAGETVLQLEEQKEHVAAQFAKEMEKSTVSAEDKQKLQIAYNNYMRELQDEIDEQKSIAGYAISKKLFIGALIASSGIAGAITYIKYYLETPKANVLPQQDSPIVPASSTALPSPKTAPIVLPEQSPVILPESSKTELAAQDSTVVPHNSEEKITADKIIQSSESDEQSTDAAREKPKKPVLRPFSIGRP